MANSTVGIQSVKNIRDALEDIQEKVAGSLTAARLSGQQRGWI